MQFGLNVKRLATKSEAGAIATGQRLSIDRPQSASSLFESTLWPVATARGSDFVVAQLIAASRRNSG